MVANTETFGGSLEDIRAFCAVVDFGTVTAAAQAMGETKGGVSRRLSRLERRLGVTLLARTPRAVTPTDEGVAFHARAREALSWLDDAADGARRTREVPRGHLRVTAPVDLGLEVLPDLVVGFRRQHPQITVELLVTDTLLDLAAHRIDLALRATPGDLPDMNYRASAIATFHDVLYAAPAYVAERGMPAEPAALAGHDMIGARVPDGAVELALGNGNRRNERVLVRPRIRTTDFASGLRLAIAGGGIVGVPDLVAAAPVAAGLLVPVLPGWSAWSGRLYAISLAGRAAPARVSMFRAFIREGLAGDAPVAG